MTNGKTDAQVSYEYISSQVDGHGVMILSEFAGAAQSLNGSLIVNPCKCCGCASPLGDLHDL